jgi:hypothetical protein
VGLTTPHQKKKNKPVTKHKCEPRTWANLLGDNIDTIEKNTEALIDASKEVGLEINVKKTKYMLSARSRVWIFFFSLMFVLNLAGGLYCAWFIYPILCWCWCPEIETSSVSWAQMSRFHLKRVQSPKIK